MGYRGASLDSPALEGSLPQSTGRGRFSGNIRENSQGPAGRILRRRNAVVAVVEARRVSLPNSFAIGSCANIFWLFSPTPSGSVCSRSSVRSRQRSKSLPLGGVSLSCTGSTSRTPLWRISRQVVMGRWGGWSSMESHLNLATVVGWRVCVYLVNV